MSDFGIETGQVTYDGLAIGFYVSFRLCRSNFFFFGIALPDFLLPCYFSVPSQGARLLLSMLDESPTRAEDNKRKKESTGRLGEGRVRPRGADEDVIKIRFMDDKGILVGTETFTSRNLESLAFGKNVPEVTWRLLFEEVASAGREIRSTFFEDPYGRVALDMDTSVKLPGRAYTFPKVVVGMSDVPGTGPYPGLPIPFRDAEAEVKFHAGPLIEKAR